MNLAPAPVRHAVASRPNALRITRAQKAIAAAMNGVDPDPEDLAGLAETRIDEQTLHLAAAAALRQVLMSRPAPGTVRAQRRSGSDQQEIRDAYYLALALALADTEGADQVTTGATLRGVCADWLAAAALIGRLQVRFLEQVCAQIDMTANHLPVPSRLAGVLSRDVLADGGRISPGTILLADHTGQDRGRHIEDGDWLHATSTVVIAGRAGPVVVDAGPDSLTASWSARIAAPVSVTPAEGRWPVSVVEDCLRMCATPVRSWVASMTRQLSGANDEDLLLRIAVPLRQFLVSPASAALAAVAGEPIATARTRTPHVALAAASATVPLLPALRAGGRERNPRGTTGLLALMRAGGEPGAELAPDTELQDCVQFAEVHRDELTLLSAAPSEDLDSEIEVTINFVTPEWQDVTALVGEVRAAGAIELSGPVVGWTDQDLVSGTGHRLSLRARVRAGVRLQTRDGYAVLLPAGTRLTLLGADVAKSHTTLYASQCDQPIARDNDTRGEQDAAA